MGAAFVAETGAQARMKPTRKACGRPRARGTCDLYGAGRLPPRGLKVQPAPNIHVMGGGSEALRRIATTSANLNSTACLAHAN
jgi:hypothetical protein